MKKPTTKKAAPARTIGAMELPPLNIDYDREEIRINTRIPVELHQALRFAIAERRAKSINRVTLEALRLWIKSPVQFIEANTAFLAITEKLLKPLQARATKLGMTNQEAADIAVQQFLDLSDGADLTKPQSAEEIKAMTNLLAVMRHKSDAGDMVLDNLERLARTVR